MRPRGATTRLLALADEAVSAAEPFPAVQAEALSALARVHLAADRVGLVLAAEGDAGVGGAIDTAVGDGTYCRPGTEVAVLLERARVNSTC